MNPQTIASHGRPLPDHVRHRDRGLYLFQPVLDDPAGYVAGDGSDNLMYRSGLVPRPLAALGLIGGPLIVLSGTLVLFDVIDQGGTGQGLATIPEFFWELGLGLYLTVKGFRPSPILSGYAREVERAAAPAPA